jgi:hypothetical protein
MQIDKPQTMAEPGMPAGHTSWRWWPAAVSIATAAVSAFWSRQTHGEIFAVPRSDFALVYASAGAWLNGSNPYAMVGPGLPYDIPFGLVYPFTAVLSAVPFTFSAWPDAAFCAAGGALFGWAIATKAPLAAYSLFTPAYIYTVQMSQWSALLTGAALVNGFGFLLASKPTVGLALLVAFWNRITLTGCALFVAVSVLLLPSWPFDWIKALPSATHTRAPVTLLAGPLILLAAVKWREPRARLLLALGAVPHTTELYEALPLFLVPSTHRQAISLAALTWGVVIARRYSGPAASYVDDMALTGQWMVWLLYLPCVWFVVGPGVRAYPWRRIGRNEN